MAKISASTYVTLELTEKEFRALKKLISNLSEYVVNKEMKLTSEEYNLTVETLYPIFKEVD